MFDKNLFTKIPFLAATVESVEKNQFKFKEIYDLPKTWISDLKDIFLESEEGLTGFTNILQMAVVPLELLLKAMTMLEPSTMKFLIQLQFLNKILPITNALQFAIQMSIMRNALAMNAEGAAVAKNAVLYDIYNGKRT